jgi:hypothetical protein
MKTCGLFWTFGFGKRPEGRGGGVGDMPSWLAEPFIGGRWVFAQRKRQRCWPDKVAHEIQCLRERLGGLAAKLGRRSRGKAREARCRTAPAPEKKKSLEKFNASRKQLCQAYARQPSEMLSTRRENRTRQGIFDLDERAPRPRLL